MSMQRRDVLATARALLADYGIADLTMRRLAKELGVQAGAIYWHIPSKQALLAELADELLAAVPLPSSRLRWDRQLQQVGLALRNTLLSQRDGAELVSAGRASMVGESAIGKHVVEIVETAGGTQEAAVAARDALLHFAIGFTLEEQTHAAMVEHRAAPDRLDDPAQTYAAALAVVVRGITGRTP